MRYLLVLLQLCKWGIHRTFTGVSFSCITQVDIPTTIGVGPGMVVAMETDKDPTPTTEKKYYIDPTFLYTPREGVEMVSPLKDGLSKLWKKRSPWPHLQVALSPGHSQILSHNRGERSREGLGSLLHHRPEIVDSVSTTVRTGNSGLS